MSEITVLLPVYNSAKYLPETLASLRAQTLKDFTILAINDGSQDESGSILDSYAIQEPRLKIVHQENKGLTNTLAWGVEQTETPFIARIDADDLCASNRLEKQLETFRNDKSGKLAVLGSAYIPIDAKSRKIGGITQPPKTHKEIEQGLWNGQSVMAHPSVMLCREAALTVGNYRKPFDNAEDYDLWLRIMNGGYHLQNLSEPLLRYRRHDSNISMIHCKEQLYSTAVALWDARQKKAEKETSLPYELNDQALMALGFKNKHIKQLRALSLLRRGKSQVLQRQWRKTFPLLPKLAATPLATLQAIRGGVKSSVPVA